MTVSFTPERSDAIRAALIDQAAATRPRRGVVWGTALVVTGALAGAGISTAAFAATGRLATPIEQPAGEPMPSLAPAVAAPAGTAPGASIISLLGKPVIAAVAAPLDIPLAARPAGATHLRVTLTALSGGGVNWGTDAGGDNPGSSFDAGDVGTPSATMWYDFPLDASTTTFYITPSGSFTATATLQYLEYLPTHLGVNARGQTYGVEGGPDGTPDLVLVVATSPAGAQVEGYARSTDLDAFSPDHPGQPANPAEALAWQEARDEKYPDGWDIPVFESDGATQIGTFHIG